MIRNWQKKLELLAEIKSISGRRAIWQRTFEVGDDEDEEEWFAEYNLLTAKPVIYAANVSEDDLADDGANNRACGKCPRICCKGTALKYL